MLEVPSFHALAAMAVTVAMFVAFVRGRMSIEIVSLLTIAVIAVGLYFFPLEGTSQTDGLALAFGGFGHYALKIAGSRLPRRGSACERDLPRAGGTFP